MARKNAEKLAREGDVLIGYYPVMQISRPNNSRGVPPCRWIYQQKEHAFSVLEVHAHTEEGRQIRWDVQNRRRTPPSRQCKPWLLLVEVPSTATPARVENTTGLPAYYLPHWSKVVEVIEVDKVDQDWIAARMERKLLKSSAFPG